MHAILITVLSWAMGSFAGALLVGGGFALVTATGLSILVNTYLVDWVAAISSGPAKVVQFALMIGVGEFVSIVGSAFLTRVAILSLSNVLGVRKV